MQVQLSRWYQLRNKEIVRCGSQNSDGHSGLYTRQGEHRCNAFTDNGNNASGWDDFDLIREVSDPTKPIQLRVGGKYLNRIGVERELESTTLEFLFRTSHPFREIGLRYTYRNNGTVSADPDTKADEDLICEILDPAPEPELVLVAGEFYECEGGCKAWAAGLDSLFPGSETMVVTFQRLTPGLYALDGNPKIGKGHPRILRPWIDPPTEFVASNGRRYRVGEEIKEPKT